MSYPRALGGGNLEGDRLVRFVYLDESGTGAIKVEPYVVMAGVIVNADLQWLQLEQYLREMADDFALPEDRHGFYFRASELAGADPKFREKYDADKRLYFLRELCAMVEAFGLPVAMGAVDRKAVGARYPEKSYDELLTYCISTAAMECSLSVNRYMRMLAPDEVATLVFEENGAKDKTIRQATNFLRSPDVKAWADANPDARIKHLDKIVDTALFAGKKDTSLLQIADAAAHVLSRNTREPSTTNSALTHCERT
jgi:hypothetical protein